MPFYFDKIKVYDGLVLSEGDGTFGQSKKEDSEGSSFPNESFVSLSSKVSQQL